MNNHLVVAWGPSTRQSNHPPYGPNLSNSDHLSVASSASAPLIPIFPLAVLSGYDNDDRSYPCGFFLEGFL